MRFIFIIILINLFFTSCVSKENKINIEKPNREIKTNQLILDYEIVNTFDIDEFAFIQGLYYKNNKLFISTGLVESSTLRIFDLITKQEIKRIDISDYFCEGISAINNYIFQLTWQDGICIVYNEDKLKKVKEFKYNGEGWGLANDGKNLIMSDGTNVIKFIDPKDFSIISSLEITDQNDFPLYNINELEYINGELWANVWTSEHIFVININTGKVIKSYDLTTLRNKLDANNNAEVLNGIAYNPEKNTYYITGKNWGKIFELKLLK